MWNLERELTDASVDESEVLQKRENMIISNISLTTIIRLLCMFRLVRCGHALENVGHRNFLNKQKHIRSYILSTCGRNWEMWKLAGEEWFCEASDHSSKTCVIVVCILGGNSHTEFAGLGSYRQFVSDPTIEKDDF
uniref:AlNc14C84G5436 protein n=1 Tax=Albugo laibachii Nc14 TaxID=890382 RepID=F0WFQ2_9STRA|nr:AlNc14C84G5436 [Albugo laibachii Nc14]|eukprot:CCA20035.1 AlNc14C84G5436 [Albugo laibachii Nc14]